jgi:sucrose-6-phosphate hydrolase SacC (GH32 family)
LDAPTLQEIAIEKGEIDIRVVVDRGSVEVFAAGGTVVLTNLVFVETALTSVQALAGANNLKATGLQTTHA